MNPILECKGLTKRYGGKTALDQITFSLMPGKIIGLLGPNGSGKTTLIKLLNGLLVPTEGQIFIDGLRPGTETKKFVSYLPERTYLNSWMKVCDIIDFFQDFYEDFDKARAYDMLKRLNINPSDRLRTMSKGTKEKVQLILVMSRRARLYCLDEPIAGVDPAARDYILSTIIQNYDEMEYLWRRLVVTPCVCCVFVTPGGKGLKALVLHDNTDPAKHGDLYDQLLRKFNVTSKDEGCKDLARRNYLSYDPDIWTNPNPVPFHYVPTVKAALTRQTNISTGKNLSGRSIIHIMNSTWKKSHPEYWQEGHRAMSIFSLACRLCRWGVEEDLAMDYFINGWESDTMTENEIVGHVRNAYKTEKRNFGTDDFTFIPRRKSCNRWNVQQAGGIV